MALTESDRMQDTTTGDDNVCVGREAGRDVTTGNNNLLLGKGAGLSNSPCGQIDTHSNVVCLGDNNIASLHCKVSTIQTSDLRDKTDVTDFKHGLSWVEKLRPITYKWDMRSNYEDGVPNGSKRGSKNYILDLLHKKN